VDVYNWVAIPDLVDEEELDTHKTGGARVEQRLRMISLQKKKLIDEYMVALQEAAHDARPAFDEAEPAVPDELNAAAMIKYLVQKAELEQESKWNITKLLIEGRDGVRHVKKHGRKRKSAQKASKIIRKKSQEMLRANEAKKAKRETAQPSVSPKARSPKKSSPSPSPKASLEFDEDATIADLMVARRTTNATAAAKTARSLQKTEKAVLGFDEDAPISELMRKRRAKAKARAKKQQAFAGFDKKVAVDGEARKTPSPKKKPSSTGAPKKKRKFVLDLSKIKVPKGFTLLT